MGAGPEECRLVVPVDEGAALQRKAAAPDAAREPVADGLEDRDALVQLAAPAAGEPLPVALRRGSVLRQRVERPANPLERDPGRLAGLHEGDPAEGDAGVAALVSLRAAGGDQPLPLVEAQRRGRDPAPARQLP